MLQQSYHDGSFGRDSTTSTFFWGAGLVGELMHSASFCARSVQLAVSCNILQSIFSCSIFLWKYASTLTALGTCCRTHFGSPLKGATEQIVASKKALDKLRADECWTRDLAEIQSTVNEWRRSVWDVFGIRTKQEPRDAKRCQECKECQESSFSHFEANLRCWLQRRRYSPGSWHCWNGFPTFQDQGELPGLETWNLPASCSRQVDLRKSQMIFTWSSHEREDKGVMFQLSGRPDGGLCWRSSRSSWPRGELSMKFSLKAMLILCMAWRSLKEYKRKQWRTARGNFQVSGARELDIYASCCGRMFCSTCPSWTIRSGVKQGKHIKQIQKKMKQSDCIRSWPICEVFWLYADNSLTCALGQAYCTIFAINGGPESFRKLCPQDRQTKQFATRTEQLTFVTWECGLQMSWLRFMAQASVALDTCIKDFTALSKVGSPRTSAQRSINGQISDGVWETQLTAPEKPTESTSTEISWYVYLKQGRSYLSCLALFGYQLRSALLFPCYVHLFKPISHIFTLLNIIDTFPYIPYTYHVDLFRQVNSGSSLHSGIPGRWCVTTENEPQCYIVLYIECWYRGFFEIFAFTL